MNKLHICLALLLLHLLGGCRSEKKEKSETENRYIRLLQATATYNPTLLAQEQSFVTDSLSADSLLAFVYAQDYLCTWADSYADTGISSLCTAAKRMARRLLEEGKEEELKVFFRGIAAHVFKQGLHHAAACIAAAAEGLDVPSTDPGEIAHRLLTALMLKDSPAPPLTRSSPHVSRGKTLLIFYESDCGNCERTLREICSAYGTLKGEGIRVVSIGANTDERMFARRAASLPWAEKWNAPEGFYSPDFIAYGVAATPTLYIIGKDGNVTGSFRTWEQAKKGLCGN